MNVWIFVISAMLNPVVEPLGLSIDAPAPVPPPVVVDPTLDEDEAEDSIRYRGIERLLANINAEA